MTVAATMVDPSAPPPYSYTNRASYKGRRLLRAAGQTACALADVPILPTLVMKGQSAWCGVDVGSRPDG